MSTVDSTIISGVVGALALTSVAALVLFPWLGERVIDSRVFSMVAVTMLMLPLSFFAVGVNQKE